MSTTYKEVTRKLVITEQEQAQELVPLRYYVRQRGPATIALTREDILKHSAADLVRILRGELCKK